MQQSPAPLNPDQQRLLDVWQQHTWAEFVAKSVDDALATMTDDPYVLLVPSLTGGIGREGVRKFYGQHFIPNVPPDLEVTPISQTVGHDRLVDESVYRFTHSIPMDWMIPGVPPTGKIVEVAVVGIIGFRDGKVASEHLYWDQSSLLVQLGLLEPGSLPIGDASVARKVLAPTSTVAGDRTLR